MASFSVIFESNKKVDKKLRKDDPFRIIGRKMNQSV